jgi:hypothetical protein
MIFILPILFLAFSLLIPVALTKRPGVEPDPGEFTVELLGPSISGDIKAVGREYRWRVHFRANYAHGHTPQPFLTFPGYVDVPGNDFELTVDKKKSEALLYFSWTGENGNRYRLLVSGDYVEVSGVYTLTDAQAEIYWMKRPKGELIDDFLVTFSFEYSPGW